MLNGNTHKMDGFSTLLGFLYYGVTWCDLIWSLGFLLLDPMPWHVFFISIKLLIHCNPLPAFILFLEFRSLYHPFLDLWFLIPASSFHPATSMVSGFRSVISTIYLIASPGRLSASHLNIFTQLSPKPVSVHSLSSTPSGHLSVCTLPVTSQLDWTNIIKLDSLGNKIKWGSDDMITALQFDSI